MANIFKNLSVKKKIVFGFLMIIVVCFLILGFFSYSYTERIIKRMALREMVNIEKLAFEQITIAAEVSKKNYLKSIAENNKKIAQEFYRRYQVGQLSEAEAKRRLKAVFALQKIGQTGYIYVLNSQGVLTYHPKPGLTGRDLSQHDFIKTQKKQKVGYVEYRWKNPGESVERNKALFMDYFEPWDMIISASSYKSEFKNVVDPKEFREEILSTKIGKTGYIYVMDLQGKLLIHPEIEGKNVYEAKGANGEYFIKEMCTTKNGTITYYWKNPSDKYAREKIVEYRYFPDQGWIIATGVYTDELFILVEKFRNMIIGIFIAVVLITTGITYLFARRLIAPLLEIMPVTTKIAQGDFTFADLEINSKDEFGQVARALTMIKHNLRQMIDQFQTSAEAVSRFAGELLKSASNTTEIVNQVVMAIEQIAVGAQQTSINSENISESSKKARESATNTTRDVGIIQEQSQEMVGTTNRGNVHIQNLGGSMEVTNEKVNVIREVMHNLIDRTQRIGKIVILIQDIAEQTNLLSLNAAIESSKAKGESGKGFAVVADEIKKLAQRATEQSKEIANVIKFAIEEIEHSAKVTEEIVDQFKEQANISQSVQEHLIELTDSINKEAVLLDGIGDQMNIAMDQSKTVFDEIANIASISEENVAATQEIKSSSEVLSQLTNVVEENAKKLMTLVNQLNTASEQFKI